ncbi:MAG: hypothetical protein V1913_04665 [Fibrobacterota bacterium]
MIAQVELDVLSEREWKAFLPAEARSFVDKDENWTLTGDEHAKTATWSHKNVRVTMRLRNTDPSPLARGIWFLEEARLERTPRDAADPPQEK